jgi:multidrug efflux system outer membrane protein
VIFDGGRVRANVDFARGPATTSTVGNYRRTVLTAMQEVEDGITGLASLDQRGDAVAGRRRKLASRARHGRPAATKAAPRRTSTSSPPSRRLLNTERQAAQLQGQRLLTAVLVKALGGMLHLGLRSRKRH